MMEFRIKGFHESQAIAVCLHNGRVKVWGNAAPKLLAALPVPHINPSYKPSKMPTSADVKRVILSNDNVIILTNDGEIGIIECQSDPWKPKECKEFCITKVSDIDTFQGTNDIVCLINNSRIAYKENKVQVRVPFSVKHIFTKNGSVILFSEDNCVYKLGLSGIPQKLAYNVNEVYAANGRVFLSILDRIYEISNNLSLLRLSDLAGATYVSDRIAIFSGGRVATFNKNCDIDDYIDISERVTSVYGYEGSYFAVGISGSVWVWGYNVGYRLGLDENFPAFVERPTLNTNL